MEKRIDEIQNRLDILAKTTNDLLVEVMQMRNRSQVKYFKTYFDFDKGYFRTEEMTKKELREELK